MNNSVAVPDVLVAHGHGVLGQPGRRRPGRPSTGVGLRLAPEPGERGVVLRPRVPLVAEEDHLPFQQRLAELVGQVRTDRVGEVDARDLGADVRRERVNAQDPVLAGAVPGAVRSRMRLPNRVGQLSKTGWGVEAAVPAIAVLHGGNG